jgi:hypothetical protein
MKLDYQQQTQAYSTWGDKLLQHTDRLHEIQHGKFFRPITLQLAPTELCDSDCVFCSVQARPKGKIPWDVLEQGCRDFIALGIKSVELTGGGNPTLYRDGSHTINDVIEIFTSEGVEVGIITNSENLKRHLNDDTMALVKWVRVSLAKLDEGFKPEDYDFTGLPDGKLGLSYIVHENTTPETFRMIEDVARANPAAKFVRIAPNCLNDDSIGFKERWQTQLEKLDQRFFVKEIGDNFHAYPGGCWVGMIRPYWTSTGVYICTSHVLMKRTYLPEYRLCGAEEISEAWRKMNERFEKGLAPYEIDISKCGHCYYRFNNQILSTVISELPDKNFA